MDTMIEQYGVAILTLVIIAMLMLIATPIGDTVRSNMLNTTNNFMTKIDHSLDTAYWN